MVLLCIVKWWSTSCLIVVNNRKVENSLVNFRSNKHWKLLLKNIVEDVVMLNDYVNCLFAVCKLSIWILLRLFTSWRMMLRCFTKILSLLIMFTCCWDCIQLVCKVIECCWDCIQLVCKMFTKWKGCLQDDRCC